MSDNGQQSESSTTDWGVDVDGRQLENIELDRNSIVYVNRHTYLTNAMVVLVCEV